MGGDKGFLTWLSASQVLTSFFLKLQTYIQFGDYLHHEHHEDDEQDEPIKKLERFE